MTIKRSVPDYGVVDMFFKESTAPVSRAKDRDSFIEHMDSLKTQGVEESTLIKSG